LELFVEPPQVEAEVASLGAGELPGKGELGADERLEADADGHDEQEHIRLRRGVEADDGEDDGRHRPVEPDQTQSPGGDDGVHRVVGEGGGQFRQADEYPQQDDDQVGHRARKPGAGIGRRAARGQRGQQDGQADQQRDEQDDTWCTFHLDLLSGRGGNGTLSTGSERSQWRAAGVIACPRYIRGTWPARSGSPRPA